MIHIPPLGTPEFRAWARTELLLINRTELKKEHQYRLYKALSKIDRRLDQARIHSLMYEPDCKLEDFEGQALRKLFTASRPGNSAVQSLKESNNRDLQDLREIKAELKKEILNEIIEGFTRLREAHAG